MPWVSSLLLHVVERTLARGSGDVSWAAVLRQGDSEALGLLCSTQQPPAPCGHCALTVQPV